MYYVIVKICIVVFTINYCSKLCVRVVGVFDNLTYPPLSRFKSLNF